MKSQRFLADLYIEAIGKGDASKSAPLRQIVEQLVERKEIHSEGLKASLIYRGIGYPQNVPQAVQLFALAKLNGDWSAARNEAKIRGLGVKGKTPETSYESIGLQKALEFLEDYSDNRGPTHKYRLGLFYLHHPYSAPFLPKADPVKAKIWLQKAADEGSTEAKTVLAHFDDVLQGNYAPEDVPPPPDDSDA